MIKILSSNPEQAVEIAEAFRNSSAVVVIEVKENTVTENSDVDNSSELISLPDGKLIIRSSNTTISSLDDL